MDALEVIFEIVNALIAIGGIFLVIRQLRRTQKTTRGEFLLKLTEMFSAYDEVASALRKNENIEKIKLTGYMGLLGRMQLLIDDDIIDEKLFMRLYAYRMRILVANPTVFERLLDEGNGWSELIRLAKKVASVKSKEQQDDDEYVQRWSQYLENVEKLRIKFPKIK